MSRNTGGWLKLSATRVDLNFGAECLPISLFALKHNKSTEKAMLDGTAVLLLPSSVKKNWGIS
jgi:hypothetical protein